MLGFVDRETGRGVTVTLWDSKEARAATAGRAQQTRQDVTAEMDAEILGVEDYELVIDER